MLNWNCKFKKSEETFAYNLTKEGRKYNKNASVTIIMTYI